MTTEFQRRRLAELRRRAYRRYGVVAALLALPTLAGLAAFSPLLDVDTVRVSGTRRLTPQEIERVAGVGAGPMVTVDTAEVRKRVTALRGVKSATVRREWPSVVVVEVVERVPVVAVPRGSAIELYDIEAVLVARGASIPRGAPTLRVEGTPTPAVISAAVAMLRALPPALREQVRDLTADGPASLSFHLADGAEVIWGSGERTREKVRALTLLVPQRAKRYDLRVPDRPAVVPR